jgi:exosome complex RNA-binding protein Rrp4
VNDNCGGNGLIYVKHTNDFLAKIWPLEKRKKEKENNNNNNKRVKKL